MKVMNYILMVLTLGTTIVFGVIDKPIQMGIMVIFPLYFGIMVIIEKLDSFKISKEGVSAKLKKMDNEITLLKETLDLFSELSLTAFSYTGNWADFSINDKEKILNDFIQKLKSKKIGDLEIDNLLEPWYKYILFTYYCKILNEMSNLARKAGGGGVVVNKELDSFNNEFRIELNNNIEHVKSYCLAHNLQSELLDKLIPDYEYFEKNKKHKSKEDWLKLISRQ